MLIDEALAVGDIFFQQKCYRRLQELKQRQKSILLVSHNLMDVEQFCDRTVILDNGKMQFIGESGEAVKRYYLIRQQRNVDAKVERHEPGFSNSKMTLAGPDIEWPLPTEFLKFDKSQQITNASADCTKIALCNSHLKASNTFRQNETAVFYYEFLIHKDIGTPTLGVEIKNRTGIIVHGKTTLEYNSDVPSQVSAGTHLRARQEVELNLAAGEYTFTVGLAAISPDIYSKRYLLPHQDLNANEHRICHVHSLGPIIITFQQEENKVQLAHHGITDLNGRCDVVQISN
jgi:ABC-type glutathione transport system ATPase component